MTSNLEDFDYSDEKWEKIVADREQFKKLNISEQELLNRYDDLKALQEHYPLFRTFLADCFMDVKGFATDDVCAEIANYMQANIRLKMVQAQREQAKSMIAGAYGVWRLIHDPGLIVLIISAGSEVASQVNLWMRLIIDNWRPLECLRADKRHGDRTSAHAFDIHWLLKGPDKSPSCACIGITSTSQGRRAGLIIADDIESAKNGLSAVQQEQILQLSKDFSNICSTGDILYLGTPQSTNSLYNTLEERGYTIRIWPGRYPTLTEEEYYGQRLAPMLVKKMLDDPTLRTGGGVSGLRGKPISPLRLGEDVLTAKELDIGPAAFELQVMLNTSLSDHTLYPLKVRDLVVLDIGMDKAPAAITWLPDPNKRVKLTRNWELYLPFAIDEVFFPFQGAVLVIDPAGGGGNFNSASHSPDETTAMVSKLLHGYIFIPEMLALPGGYSQQVFIQIAAMSVRHRIRTIQVEENLGKGAFATMLRPVVMRAWREAGLEGYPLVEDVWESGNKNKRMIQILEPLLARHRLVISPEVLRYDEESIKQYPARLQQHYSLLDQMARATLQSGCLLHDDRLDVLTNCCKYWLERLNVDEIAKKQDRERVALLKLVNEIKTPKHGGKLNAFDRKKNRTRRK